MISRLAKTSIRLFTSVSQTPRRGVVSLGMDIDEYSPANYLGGMLTQLQRHFDERLYMQTLTTYDKFESNTQSQPEVQRYYHDLVSMYNQCGRQVTRPVSVLNLWKFIVENNIVGQFDVDTLIQTTKKAFLSHYDFNDYGNMAIMLLRYLKEFEDVNPKYAGTADELIVQLVRQKLEPNIEKISTKNTIALLKEFLLSNPKFDRNDSDQFIRELKLYDALSSVQEFLKEIKVK
jgi:hypothetical protein